MDLADVVAGYATGHYLQDDGSGRPLTWVARELRRSGGLTDQGLAYRALDHLGLLDSRSSGLDGRTRGVRVDD